MSNSTDNTIVSQLQSATTAAYAYAGLVILILGTVGNFCNIVVFVRQRTLIRLPSSWFLLASFVGSQLVLSTGLISRVILGLSRVDPLTLSTVWCRVRWTLGPTGGFIALFCISLASIDRYLITSWQVNRHRWITVRRAQYIILIAVLISLLIPMPNAIFYTNPSCRATDPIYAQFNAVESLITYSITPILILIIFCILTWFNLHYNGNVAIRRNRLQQQVNRMMIAQMCIVVLTSVPNVTVQTYSTVTRTMDKSSIRVAIESLVTALLTLLGFTTHAGTFYVYLMASRAFRENVKSVFLLAQHHANRVTPGVMMLEQRVRARILT